MRAPSAFGRFVQTPFSVPVAIAVKRLGLASLFLASFAVLYSGMSPHNGAHYVNSVRADILLVALFTLLHLTYLYLVFNIFILGRAIEAIRPADVLIPFLLIIVYCLYGLHSLAYNKGEVLLSERMEMAAYLLFICLYAAWLVKDLRSTKWRDKAEATFWIFIDAIVIGVLITHIVGLWGNGIHLLSYSVTGKDIATVLCIVLWAAARVYTQDQSRRHYSSEYRTYLTFNNVSSPASRIPSFDLPRSNLRIVDFGCGDGTRLIQQITWFKEAGRIDDNANIVVTGHDRDDSWKTAYDTHCKDANFVASFRGEMCQELEDDIRAADVILLSHVLYELKSCNSIQKLVDMAKSGAIVIARGTAAKSYFTVVNLAFSRRFLKPTISHLWQQHGLNLLKRGNMLISLGECYVDQTYDLQRGGARAAVELLSYLYGTEASELAQEYFDSMLHEGRTTVSNDDIVVYLRRS